MAREVFGPALPAAQRYWRWLATAGLERGLLGPREVDRLWDRHLLNSTAVLPFLPETGRVLDLGSGAGLPGIVVALLRPDLDVVLLEPMARRSSFLTEVVADLGLPRTTVVRARVQEYTVDHASTVSAVTARAVAPLARLAQWSAPLLVPGGRLVALKGETAAEELEAARVELARCGLSAAPPHRVTIGDSVTSVVCADLTHRAPRAPEQGGSTPGTPRRTATRRKRR